MESTEVVEGQRREPHPTLYWLSAVPLTLSSISLVIVFLPNIAPLVLVQIPIWFLLFSVSLPLISLLTGIVALLLLRGFYVSLFSKVILWLGIVLALIAGVLFLM